MNYPETGLLDPQFYHTFLEFQLIGGEVTFNTKRQCSEFIDFPVTKIDACFVI